MGHNALLVQLAAADGATLYAKVTLPGRRDRDHVHATALLEAQLSDACSGEIAVPLPARGPDGAFATALAGGWLSLAAAIPGVSLRRTLADPRATIRRPMPNRWAVHSPACMPGAPR